VAGIESGWIDGTITRTASPVENQRILYSAFKKCYGFKFQCVMTPDGMISSLAGPMCASRNDWHMFTNSHLSEKIIEMWTRHRVPEEERLFIFGDPAYCGSLVTIGAYRRPQHGRLPATEALFNYDISQNSIYVEHGFAILSNKWMKLEECFGTVPFGSTIF
jgi:DDE superfamily endonuclease